MSNSANNESLNITDEVIKKSATIKAYTEWKKNTSYSEDIKNKVEFAMQVNEIGFEDDGQPYNEFNVIERYAYNDSDAERSVESINDLDEKTKSEWNRPKTKDEVEKDRREAEKFFEEAVERSCISTKAAFLKSERYQLQVPSGLDILIQSASAAQGRSAASFALYALEYGLNQLLENGSIPKIAEKKYQSHCEMLAALGDVKTLFKKVAERDPYFEEKSCY